MLGKRRTLALWRQRRPNFLALERALTTQGRRSERHTDAEHAVLEQKAARRRFEQAKGRIHPST
jgi:hypothetical protein